MILLVITPGPDMALVTRNAISGGLRAAVATALGVETGRLVWTAASAWGLATLLEASVFGLTLVKLAGAAYLVYLGIRTLVALKRPETAEPHITTSTQSPGGSPLRQGLLSNLLNPQNWCDLHESDPALCGGWSVIDGVTGSVLVGFGVRLANEVRSARIAPA